MRSRVEFAIFAGALLVPAAPVRAAGGSVEVAQFGVVHHLENGGGWVAAYQCHALARPPADPFRPDFPDVPLSTSVGCSVNGVESTVTRPGALASTSVSNVGAGPVVICRWASAVYYDPDDAVIYAFEREPRCNSA